MLQNRIPPTCVIVHAATHNEIFLQMTWMLSDDDYDPLKAMRKQKIIVDIVTWRLLEWPAEWCHSRRINNQCLKVIKEKEDAICDIRGGIWGSVRQTKIIVMLK